MSGALLKHGLSLLGGIGGGAVESGAKGPGSRAAQQWFNGKVSNEIPGVPELLWAYRTGRLNAKTTADMLRGHGVPFLFARLLDGVHDLEGNQKVWEKIYESQEPQPATGELLTALNRGTIDLAETAQRLQRSGFSSDDTRKILLALRYEVPGPSDLVRFAVRHVFEPDLIKALGYDDEYRPILDAFHRAQGVDYPIFSGPLEKVVQAVERESGLGIGSFLAGYRGVGLPEPTWARAYWWSHWILPSPSQGYEMLQRLRAVDNTTGKARDPSGEVFSDKDLALLLRANDYPPFWRGKLAAISYRPIGLRQLAQLYQFGVMDQPELIEGWQDLGFRRQTAIKLAELTVRQDRVRRWKAQTTGIQGKVLRAYETGTVTRDDAAVKLYELGLQDPDLLRSFAALGQSAQIKTANDDLAVIVRLDAVDADIRAKLVDKAIAGTRKIYLSGRINRLQAQNRLSTLGLTQERIGTYLQVWDYEQTPHTKELRSEQILRLHREQIIGAPDALARLVNLGWGVEDATLLLAQVARSLQLDLARAARQAAQTQKERTRAQTALVRAARAEHQRARQELARHGNPSQLGKWLSKGLVGAPEMRARLLALDWPLADIEREIADSLLAASKKQKSPYVPQPLPVPGQPAGATAPGG